MPPIFYAHTSEKSVQVESWQDLESHLKNVASLAAQKARFFGADDWAFLAGLWHDLGKYRTSFQNRLFGASGLPLPFPLGKNRPETEHAIVGAVQAVKAFGQCGRILAYPIAGHHGGLPDWEGQGHASLIQRLEKKELLAEALAAPPPQDILKPPKPAGRPVPGLDPALWIRMIFSCLVDADYLDTEAFMDPDRANRRPSFPALDQMAPLFFDYLNQLMHKAVPGPVNEIRREVLQACRKQAQKPPGLFSLTVPTGGGKTLSALALALTHAQKYGLRRIIYVIPYLSIIEQTAAVLQRFWGQDVLEHHSSVVIEDEDEDEYSSRRLASENWDAPVVVTTAVQFFESLFAARPGRCRKLHNICQSVVILDEAQLLPPDFLKPILKTLQQLANHYGSSLVLCTATQPALKPIDTMDFKFKGLAGLREVMDDPLTLHQRMKRVRVHLPEDMTAISSWEEVAAGLRGYDAVLCIVNTRQDAADLFQLMDPADYHLSARLCPAHRSQVIDEIKLCLDQNRPVRVISTQLIECGVDVDFPVVYRALAGLDSLAQAAGRCNREGRLPQGEVHIFIPPKPCPPGHLRQAEEAARIILERRPADPLDPALFREYFRHLFWIKGDGLDRHGLLEDLKPDGQGRFSFRTAADKFRIIQEADRIPILVCWGRGMEVAEKIRQQGTRPGLLRRAQGYMVNIPEKSAVHLLADGSLERLPQGVYVLSDPKRYDQKLGVILKGPDYREPEDLIV